MLWLFQISLGFSYLNSVLMYVFHRFLFGKRVKGDWLNATYYLIHIYFSSWKKKLPINLISLFFSYYSFPSIILNIIDLLTKQEEKKIIIIIIKEKKREKKLSTILYEFLNSYIRYSALNLCFLISLLRNSFSNSLE